MIVSYVHTLHRYVYDTRVTKKELKNEIKMKQRGFKNKCIALASVAQLVGMLSHEPKCHGLIP